MTPEKCQVKLLFFTAPWCPPCKTMKTYGLPALHKRRKEAGLPPLEVIYVNVDDKEINDPRIGSPFDLGERFKVRSLPTLLLLAADAELVPKSTLIGAKEAVGVSDLVQMISEAVALLEKKRRKAK